MLKINCVLNHELIHFWNFIHSFILNAVFIGVIPKDLKHKRKKKICGILK